MLIIIIIIKSGMKLTPVKMLVFSYFDYATGLVLGL